jgi:hypothetical protein
VFVGNNGEVVSNFKTRGFFFFDFDALSPDFTIPKVLS